MRNKLSYCFCLIFLINNCLSLHCQLKADKIFDDSQPLNLELRFNFNSFFSAKSENEAILAYFYTADLSSPLKSQYVYISKRGNFRKKPENCDFPSYLIRFQTTDTALTSIDKKYSLKVVTQCRANSEDFKMYVIQEYLIYKIYNLLTDKSFKVRLVNFTYTDSAQLHDTVINVGFFVEDLKNLTNRLKATELDFKYIQPEATDGYYFTLMYLFQKMIINFDWSVSLRHNIDLIGFAPNYKPIPVPYDFDMAALTQIPYNSPSIPFKPGEMPYRKFEKIRAIKSDINRAIQQIQSQKENIYNLYHVDKYLPDSTKNKIIKSLDLYFKDLEKEF